MQVITIGCWFTMRHGRVFRLHFADYRCIAEGVGTVMAQASVDTLKRISDDNASLKRWTEK